MISKGCVHMINICVPTKALPNIRWMCTCVWYILYHHSITSSWVDLILRWLVTIFLECKLQHTIGNVLFFADSAVWLGMRGCTDCVIIVYGERNVIKIREQFNLLWISSVCCTCSLHDIYTILHQFSILACVYSTCRWLSSFMGNSVPSSLN